MFRFSLRSLLLLTAVVAASLAVAVRHSSRMHRLARQHDQQAVLVAEQIALLQSVSFDVPQHAWDEYDRQERLHLQLAVEYRQKAWRPWLPITKPSPPLPIQVEVVRR